MKTEQKTILIVADFGYVEGGAAKVALGSVRLLHKASYKVILFCGSEKIDPEIVALGIRIEKLGMYQLKENPSKINAMLNGLWNSKAAARLKALLAELDSQQTVVHVHSWTKILSPAIFSVLRKSGFKTIITAHDYFLVCPNGAFFDYRHNHVCPYKGGNLRCLCCNCDVRNYVQKVWRWMRHRIVMFQMKHFAHLTVLTISKLNDEILRKSLVGTHTFCRVNNPLAIDKTFTNSIAGKSDFIFIGRASPEKGLNIFARAVSESSVHGVALGGGADLDKIRNQYPNVEYLGWVPPGDVRRIASSRAAVLIFPSICYETAGLTPLEVMSLGIPCIISDVTAAREYIDDGRTGLLFRSGDLEDLIRKIEMMKGSSFRERLSENIRKYFDISKWSEESYVKRLSKVYASLTEEGWNAC